jgi:hypothetical protein
MINLSNINKRSKYVFLLLSIFIFVIATIIFFLFFKVSLGKNEVSTVENAKEAGKNLSHNKCKEEGPVELSVSPMKPEDFSILIPYGLVVGGHVTPIDHQYFSPTVFHSPRDTYEVRAMADGRIVEIGARQRQNPNDPNDKFEEYRIVFSHTCTFFTYYDLVTSLTPDLKTEYEKTKNADGYSGRINFPVKAGQVIGKIGGQTLDFAVWNTEKPLSGFVILEHYKDEPWKIYTANPYDYYTEELKELLIERNPRTVPPIEGKIDYDIDGKLIGNWFLEGSEGYIGGRISEYWKTHLSIVPDHYDPTRFIVSFGDFNGETKQLAISDSSFDPALIGVSSGLQKLNLASYSYTDGEGNLWNGFTLIKSPKLIPGMVGDKTCVLFELIEDRKLKMEAFPEIECSDVSEFTNNTKIYER